jgi:ABC-2 type transport system ATP-binding protein
MGSPAATRWIASTIIGGDVSLSRNPLAPPARARRTYSVLLSSHLLPEVEAVADELVLISGGRIVARGPKTDLLAAAGTVVRSPDVDALTRALTEAGLPHSSRSDGSLLVSGSIEDVGRAAARGAVLTELRPASGTGLEELFLRLTSGARDEVAA